MDVLPQDEPRADVPASLWQALADVAHEDLVARIWRLTKRLNELTLALATAPRPEGWPRGPYWQWWYAVRARVLRGESPDLKALEAAEARRVNLPPHLR